LSLARDTLITFGTRIGLALVLFARSVLTARVLQPAGKGTLGLILMVPALLQMVGEMGISMANVYLLGRRRARVSSVTGNSLVISAAAGVLLLGAYFGALHAGLLDSFLKDSPRWALTMATLVFPMALFTQYASSILQGQRRLILYNVARSATQVFYFVGLVIVLLALNGRVGESVIAFFFSTIAGFALALFLVLRSGRFQVSVEPRSLRRAISFGLKGHLSSILGFLNMRLDIFLVSHYLGLASLGHYVIAVAVAEFILHFPRSIVAALFPRVSAAGETESADIAARAIRNGLFLTVVTAAGILVLNVPFIHAVYGSAYAPSTRAIWALLPGVVAASLGVMMKGYIVGRGRPMIASGSSFAALVVNVGLNVILIPRMGIVGAALASTVSYALHASVLLVFFLRTSGLTARETLVINTKDIGYYKTALAKLLGKEIAGTNG